MSDRKFILVKVYVPEEGYDDVCDELVKEDFYQTPMEFETELLNACESLKDPSMAPELLAMIKSIPPMLRKAEVRAPGKAPLWEGLAAEIETLIEKAEGK
jgi:hypothetical protein